MLNNLVDALKARADIVEVIEALGVGTFRTAARNRKFRGDHCPGESKDACVVDGRNGWWKCFRCGEGGDVINWVLSAKFKGDRARRSDALNWLAGFYEIAADEAPLDIPRREAYELLTDLSWIWNATLLQEERYLGFCRDQWGLTRETVEALRIGFCDGLSKAPFDPAIARNAGLIDEKNNQPLTGRIVFPFLRDGLVVWMGGRLPYDHADAKRYLALYQTNYVQAVLYNYDNALNSTPETPLVITEGLGDAAAAYQNGIRAVAVAGTSLFSTGDDVPRLLRSCKDYKYIVFDSEASGNGHKGARRLAEKLIQFEADPVIVDLPRGDRPKVDLAEFLKTEGAAGFCDVIQGHLDLSKPKTLPNILIEECPVYPEPEQLSDLIATIAPLPTMFAVRYLEALSDKTGLNMAELKKAMVLAKRRTKKTSLEVDDEWSGLAAMAQDYVHNQDTDVWTAHTCVIVPHIETVAEGGKEAKRSIAYPVYMTVDLFKDKTYSITHQDVIKNPDAATKERLPAMVVLKSENNRWSVSRKYVYSFTNFVEGNAPTPDIRQVYLDILNLYNRYIIFPDTRDASLLVLYIIYTYIYMGFRTVPYLHLTGKKDSGKSSAMDIAGILCFNTAPSVSMTEPVLFRIAHATRSTFIIDEAEKLKNPTPGTMDHAILQICLGSYNNSDQAQALRCGRDTLQPEAFRTYSPKIFGSIQRLKDTLSSRSIPIHCATADPSELQRLDDFEADVVYLGETFQNIRDRLRIFGLTQFRTVREAFEEIGKTEADFLFTRDRQIWKPLMALARVIGEDVYTMIISLANDKIDRRKAYEATYDFGNVVLITLYDLLEGEDGKPMNEKAGYYFARNKKQDCIALGIAVDAIKERLMHDKIWAEKFTKLDANFLGYSLRQIGVIAEKEKGNVASVNGMRRKVMPFKFDMLEKHLALKGLLSEPVSNGTGQEIEVEVPHETP